MTSRRLFPHRNTLSALLKQVRENPCKELQTLHMRSTRWLCLSSRCCDCCHYEPLMARSCSHVHESPRLSECLSWSMAYVFQFLSLSTCFNATFGTFIFVFPLTFLEFSNLVVNLIRDYSGPTIVLVSFLGKLSPIENPQSHMYLQMAYPLLFAVRDPSDYFVAHH